MVMDWNKLKEPFAADDIEWRIGQAGAKNKKPWAKVLAYITSRAIMDRLDDVCGNENWRNEFSDIPNHDAVACTIYIKIDGEWVGKEDAAPYTAIEPIKGGRSDAMKRAAVHWGIGRYLYDLESAFADICDNGKHFQKGKINDYDSFKWNPPKLPAWALPEGAKEEKKPASRPKQPDAKPPVKSTSTTDEPKDATDDQMKKLKDLYYSPAYASMEDKAKAWLKKAIEESANPTENLAKKFLDKYDDILI